MAARRTRRSLPPRLDLGRARAIQEAGATKNPVTLGARKLFLLISALYAGYCALCCLIPSARLGNIIPAGLSFVIVGTNFVGR